MKFLRNTHCECGKPRQLDELQQDFWNKHPAVGFLVHMLDSKKPMTMREVWKACKDYNSQMGEDPQDPNSKLENIAHGLIVGCEWGLIKSV